MIIINDLAKELSISASGLKHIDGFFAFLGIEPTFKA